MKRMTRSFVTTPGERSTSGAHLTLEIGQALTLDARVTTSGLLSIGALVSGILLSSAVIVVAARQPRLR